MLLRSSPTMVLPCRGLLAAALLLLLCKCASLTSVSAVPLSSATCQSRSLGFYFPSAMGFATALEERFYLDCSNLGIDSLAVNDFSTYNWPLIIDLSGNQLTSLPANFFDDYLGHFLVDFTTYGGTLPLLQLDLSANHLDLKVLFTDTISTAFAIPTSTNGHNNGHLGGGTPIVDRDDNTPFDTHPASSKWYNVAQDLLIRLDVSFQRSTPMTPAGSSKSDRDMRTGRVAHV